MCWILILRYTLPFHLPRLLSHRVGGLLPDIVVSALSLGPHELELEFAFVVFALVVERAQDTVVRVLGFRRVNAQPLARWVQVFGTSLADQQLPRSWLRCWGEVGWLHIT